MNIAYFCADVGIPIYGYKGSSVHIRSMVTEWQRMGHNVTIFAPDTRTGQEQPLHGIEFVTVTTHLPSLYSQVAHELDRADGLLGATSRVKQDLRNYWQNVAFYDQVVPHLSHGAYDFIYERYTIFHYAGVALAKAFGLPHLLEVNAPLCYEKEMVAGLEMKVLGESIEARLMRESDRIAVVSETLRQFALERGASPEKILLTPNGIDPVVFQPQKSAAAAIRNRYQITEEQTVIGFVGSLKPWHGTNTLVEALEHLKRYPVHLLLVGDGPERSNLQAQVAALELTKQVTFTGNIPHDEVPAYIAAMDIACAPYLAQENFYFSPIKIFEYMAGAKAVVAGNIGQVPEIIHHGQNGLLYSPGDVTALAQALASLVLNPHLAASYGARGHEWVLANRTWRQNATTILEAVTALQHRKKDPRSQLSISQELSR